MNWYTHTHQLLHLAVIESSCYVYVQMDIVITGRVYMLLLSIYIELLCWNHAVEITIDQERLMVAGFNYSGEDLPGQDQ